jgi:hypothetical protein
VQGCAGPAGSWMRGEGFGMSEPGTATGVWPGVFAEAGVLVAVSSHLSLRGSVGGVTGWGAPTFAIRNVGVIHTPGPAGRAALGMRYRF